MRLRGICDLWLEDHETGIEKKDKEGKRANMTLKITRYKVAQEGYSAGGRRWGEGRRDRNKKTILFANALIKN